MSGLAYLRPAYLLSIPERLLRALAAAAGGLVYEAAELLLPDWLRRSRLYQATIYRLLRLIIELAGGVQGVLPPDSIGAKELALRKTFGNLIELLGFLAVGWSPLWVLAAASDLTGGTRAYLNAFVAELQRDGLLGEGVDIQSVDELLNALETSSALMADMVDVPPMKVQDLKESWQSLKSNTRALPDPAQLSGLFQQMQQLANREGRSLGAISSLLAAGALRAGVQMGSTHIFAYYHQALDSIHAEGFGRYARRVIKPYYSAARGHFDPQRTTYTQRALARLRR